MDNWQIGDDIAIRFAQVDDEQVTAIAHLEKMIDAINDAVAPYGFKVRAYGTWGTMLNLHVREKQYLDVLAEVSNG